MSVRAFDVPPLRARRGLRRWAKYAAIAQAQAATGLAYWAEQAVRGIHLFLIIVVFVQLWRVTYAVTGAQRIAGFTLPQMIGYLVLTETIVMSNPRIEQVIDQEVRGGEIAYRLVRPVHYVAFHFWSAMGQALASLPVNFAVASLAAWLTLGDWVFPLAAAPAFLVAMTLGMAIHLLVSITIGLLAFWTEDTWPFAFVWTRLVMILGGMMLPLDAFPDWLARVAKALPMNLVVYGPARLGMRFDWSEFGTLVWHQLIWIAVLLGVVSWVFGKGARRLHVQGG